MTLKIFQRGIEVMVIRKFSGYYTPGYTPIFPKPKAI